ncbi:hypothetical protein HDU76_006167, partial [Blyttiomyces sp. JEL0837]
MTGAVQRKGIFTFNRVPTELEAGESFRGWTDLKLGTSVTSDGPVVFEVVGLAEASWILKPESIFASDEMRATGKMRRLGSTGEFWKVTVKLAESQEFDKGEHTYITTAEVPKGLFPTFQYIDRESGEEFAVKYIVRARFPARENPVETLTKPLIILSPPLGLDFPTPLNIQDRGPLGAILSLKSKRSQWHPKEVATLLYSLRAPPTVEVGRVLVELVQRVGLPGPNSPEHRVGIERIVAYYEVPGCPAGFFSTYLLQLELPMMPPTICLGPLDISYEIRCVATFPPSVPGGQAVVEFLGPSTIIILPTVQKINLPPNFDEIHEAGSPSGPPPPPPRTLRLSPKIPAAITSAPPPPQPQSYAQARPVSMYPQAPSLPPPPPQQPMAAWGAAGQLPPPMPYGQPPAPYYNQGGYPPVDPRLSMMPGMPPMMPPPMGDPRMSMMPGTMPMIPPVPPPSNIRPPIDPRTGLIPPPPQSMMYGQQQPQQSYSTGPYAMPPAVRPPNSPVLRPPGSPNMHMQQQQMMPGGAPPPPPNYLPPGQAPPRSRSPHPIPSVNDPEVNIVPHISRSRSHGELLASPIAMTDERQSGIPTTSTADAAVEGGVGEGARSSVGGEGVNGSGGASGSGSGVDGFVSANGGSVSVSASSMVSSSVINQQQTDFFISSSTPSPSPSSAGPAPPPRSIYSISNTRLLAAPVMGRRASDINLSLTRDRMAPTSSSDSMSATSGVSTLQGTLIASPLEQVMSPGTLVPEPLPVLIKGESESERDEVSVPAASTVDTSVVGTSVDSLDEPSVVTWSRSGSVPTVGLGVTEVDAEMAEIDKRRTLNAEQLRRLEQERLALMDERRIQEAQLELERLKHEEQIRLEEKRVELERLRVERELAEQKARLELELAVEKQKAETEKIRRELEALKMKGRVTIGSGSGAAFSAALGAGTSGGQGMAAKQEYNNFGVGVGMSSGSAAMGAGAKHEPGNVSMGNISSSSGSYLNAHMAKESPPMPTTNTSGKTTITTTITTTTTAAAPSSTVANTNTMASASQSSYLNPIQSTVPLAAPKKPIPPPPPKSRVPASSTANTNISPATAGPSSGPYRVPYPEPYEAELVKPVDAPSARAPPPPPPSGPPPSIVSPDRRGGQSGGASSSSNGALRSPSSRLAEIAAIPAQSVALPPRRGPAQPPKSAVEDPVKQAYINVLEAYRDRLLQYLSQVGTPMAKPTREVTKQDLIRAMGQPLLRSPNSAVIMDALNAEMKLAEEELGESYEASRFHALVDRMMESGVFLSDGIEAGVIQTTDDFNAECTAFLEHLKESAAKPAVPMHIWEQAMLRFDEDVRVPLLKKVREKEAERVSSGQRSRVTTASASGSGSGSGGANPGGMTSNGNASSPRGNQRERSRFSLFKPAIPPPPPEGYQNPNQMPG